MKFTVIDNETGEPAKFPAMRKDDGIIPIQARFCLLEDGSLALAEESGLWTPIIPKERFRVQWSLDATEIERRKKEEV